MDATGIILTFLAGLGGLALMNWAFDARWVTNAIVGASGEWRTARAIKKQCGDAVSITRGRIIDGPSGSTEIDILVAAPGVLYVVEVKRWGCHSVTGGTNDAKWTANYGPVGTRRRRYGRQRSYPFQNPLKQAERQATAVRTLLAASGIERPVYRSVVLLGPQSIPQITGVFGEPAAFARWLARHSTSGENAQTDDARGAKAMTQVVKHSRSGLRARIAHVWQIGQHREAAKMTATVAAAAFGLALVVGCLVTLLGHDTAQPPATMIATAAEPGSPIEIPASDQCDALAAGPVLVTDGAAGALIFVGTGELGSLRDRSGSNLKTILAASQAVAKGQNVERLAFAILTETNETVVSSARQGWLACSADNKRMLTRALKGRFIKGPENTTAVRAHTRAVGILSADGSCWPYAEQCIVFDWLSAPERPFYLW